MKKVKQVDKGEPVNARTEEGKKFVAVGNARVFLRGKLKRDKRDKVEKKKGEDKEE